MRFLNLVKKYWEYIIIFIELIAIITIIVLLINNVYYKTGLDFDEVLVLANYFNENILEKPFPEKTVKYKVKKVFEKPRDSYIYIKLEE